MLRGRALVAALVGLLLSAPVVLAAPPAGSAIDALASRAIDSPPSYAIDATLDPAERTLAGAVAIRLVNTTKALLADVALVLYPNRFAVPDPSVDDVNRPFIYPREDFVAGGMTVEAIDADGRPTGAPRFESLGGFDRTVLRASLPEPLAPGASTTIRARFRTVFPERFGPFGSADGRIAALDGWFPSLPTLAADGTWDLVTPPRPAHVKGTLAAPTDYKVFVGETLGPSRPPTVSTSTSRPARRRPSSRRPTTRPTAATSTTRSSPSPSCPRASRFASSRARSTPTACSTRSSASCGNGPPVCRCRGKRS